MTHTNGALIQAPFYVHDQKSYNYNYNSRIILIFMKNSSSSLIFVRITFFCPFKLMRVEDKKGNEMWFKISKIILITFHTSF